MRIKICGLNPIRDVQICIDLKVDFLGFVFYQKSPRNINLNEVTNLLKYKKQKSSFVAVTVNPADEFIKNTVVKNFDYIQLHGDETNERIKKIKSMGLKIIKAIKVREESDINLYQKYSEADIILFDTPGMEKSFEFPKNLISKIPRGDRFALAGSISENNVEKIAKLGVNFFDISSNLESELGHKDHLKIKSFLNKLNNIYE